MLSHLTLHVALVIPPTMNGSHLNIALQWKPTDANESAFTSMGKLHSHFMHSVTERKKCCVGVSTLLFRNLYLLYFC